MKVGDYVRDHTNGIGRVIKCYNNELEIVFNKATIKTTVSSYFEFNLNKSSPNIIDLIEVGDYVNGEQVSRIKQCPEYHLGDGILIFNEHNETIYSNFRTSKYFDIASIVTKECFESMEYKVKE